MPSEVDNLLDWFEWNGTRCTTLGIWHKNRLYAHCTVVNYTPDVGKALKEHAGYERFIVPEK